jgi:hypothetical protein
MENGQNCSEVVELIKHPGVYLYSVFEGQQNVQSLVLGQVFHVDTVVDVP